MGADDVRDFVEAGMRAQAAADDAAAQARAMLDRVRDLVAVVNRSQRVDLQKELAHLLQARELAAFLVITFESFEAKHVTTPAGSLQPSIRLAIEALAAHLKVGGRL